MFLVLSIVNCSCRSNYIFYCQFTHSVIDSLVRPLTHHQVRAVLEEIMEKLPEEFNMVELLGKAEERTPYQVVALQECERMNVLTQEIRRSLCELSLGLKVRGL